MLSYTILIDTINEYEENNQLFFVTGCAKEWYPVLKYHLNELMPLAREAVEHYTEVNQTKIAR